MTQGEVAPPYRGPEFSGPQYSGPQDGGPQYPGHGPVYPPPPSLSDEQLRHLPPPPYGPGPALVRPTQQRPAVIGLAVTLAVTAALLWVCALSLGWLLAIAGTRVLDQSGSDGVVFHLLDRFRDRLLDGLALPLYLFPLASVVSGFLLLNRRPWPRLVHTAIGVLALAWSAWWLRDALLEWASVALYVGVAVSVLWTPAATRWYASRP